MTSPLVPVADLQLDSGLVHVRSGTGSAALAPVVEPTFLRVLETFVHQQHGEHPYVTYRRRCEAIAGSRTSSELEGLLACKPLMVVRRGRMVCTTPQRSLDLTAASRVGLVLERFATSSDPARTLSDQNFSDVTQCLARLGLLVPPPGRLDLGDLRRTGPLCRNFGLTRGTPIDRYYLGRFLDCARPDLRGDVLEIGGVQGHREVYRLSDVASYTVLDKEHHSGVDLVGDVLDALTFSEHSFDAIIAFNVLEHVSSPALALENMHRWLRPGGHVASMVPSVQRVHLSPNDYWRILPAGMERLHSMFSQRALSVYGNALTSTAALMGIAAEELSAEELDAFDPDYPVATCMRARKAGRELEQAN